MAINYQLAELVQKTFNTDVSTRKQNLLRARGHYERFLKLLDSYDVLGKADAKLFETYGEDKNNFSTASTRDAAAKRDAKITRFREEKELKRKLEVRIALDISFRDGSGAKARDIVFATEPQACGAR
jgi:immunoglobulin-binding protein 1